MFPRKSDILALRSLIVSMTTHNTKWISTVHVIVNNHISAYVKHRLANLEPNENLFIASSFSIQTCKSAFLHNHEYSLNLPF